MSVEAPVAPIVSSRASAFSFERRDLVRAGIVVVILLVALFFIPGVLSTFWVKIFTGAAITSVVAAGLGMLYGRVGMASLGQVALLGVGAWTTMRLSFAWPHAPFLVLVLLGALVTTVVGVGIGLPALRLSGLYLALVTLMAAAAVNIVLASLKFPNGGPGFKGIVKDVQKRKEMRRPAIALGDIAYFRYVVIVAFLCFMLYAIHLARKPGRAWASVRQSEAAALSAGINITVYKLWAFALASFVTGIAGALLAARVGSPQPANFATNESLIVLAVVILAGYNSLWAAVGAGLLKEVFPEFLKDRGVSDRIGLILFGIGVTVNLILTTRAMKKKGLIS